MPYFLKKIYMQSFGIFNKATLDGLQPGLNIIYAPNEAGKSTLCAFILGVLFGWPVKSSKVNSYNMPGCKQQGTLTFEQRPSKQANSPLTSLQEAKRLVHTDNTAIFETSLDVSRETSLVLPDNNHSAHVMRMRVITRGHTKNKEEQDAIDSILQGVSKELYESTFFITQESVQAMLHTADVAAALLTASTGTYINPNTLLNRYDTEEGNFFRKAAEVPYSFPNINTRIVEHQHEYQACFEMSQAQYGANELLARVQDEQRRVLVRIKHLTDQGKQIERAKEELNRLMGIVTHCDEELAKHRSAQDACRVEEARLQTLPYYGLVRARVQAGDLRELQAALKEHVAHAQKIYEMKEDAYHRACERVNVLPRSMSSTRDDTATRSREHVSQDHLLRPEQYVRCYRRYCASTSALFGLLAGVILASLLAVFTRGTSLLFVSVLSLLAAVVVAILLFTWQNIRLERTLTKYYDRAHAYQCIERAAALLPGFSDALYPPVSVSAFVSLLQSSKHSSCDENDFSDIQKTYQEYESAYNNYLSVRGNARSALLKAGIPDTVGSVEDMCAFGDEYVRYVRDLHAVEEKKAALQEEYHARCAEQDTTLENINQQTEELYVAAKEVFKYLKQNMNTQESITKHVTANTNDTQLMHDIATLENQNRNVVEAVVCAYSSLEQYAPIKEKSAASSTQTLHNARVVSDIFDTWKEAYNKYAMELSRLQARLEARCNSGHTNHNQSIAEQEIRCLQAQKLQSCERLIEVMARKLLLQQALDAWNMGDTSQVWSVASELLSQLTEGAWIALQPTPDKKDISVTDANGIQQPPKHLSSGTKAQLYFSIKVALLLKAAHVGESLPVVVDDALLTLDTHRRLRTARVLAQLAQRRQVLFFTCHEEIRDCIMQAASTAKLVKWSR